MTIQLTGTGIDNAGINPITPKSGQFTVLNTTGSVSAAIGQNFVFNTNGTNKAQIDTTGNLKLLTSTAAFQNTIGDAISPYGAFRNKIINGNFDFWQRGTTQSAFSGYGSDDRWVNSHAGSSKVHSQQAFTIGQTAVPNNPKYFSRTVVSSIAGASNFVVKAHYIEDVSKLSGKTLTLSFWGKADTNRNIAIDFSQYFGSTGSPSAQVNFGSTIFALTSSWQKFTTTVSFPSVAGKTLGTDTNNDRNVINFWFDAGSTYNSRTNSLGQQSGTFDIAQVQLEEGNIATPFETRPQEVEFALCQRYYEIVGGAVNTVAANGYCVSSGSGGAALWISYSVSKRITPIVTKNGTWFVSNVSQPTVNGITTEGFKLGAVSTATNTGCTFYCDSTDDFITIDAEFV
jgi:hypothetical protein